MLNPINLLNKGYSIVTKDNSAVGSVTNIDTGDIIEVRMSDGTVECQVESINKFGD